MIRIWLKLLFVPVLFCWFIKGSDCAREDTVVINNLDLDAKLTEILKQSNESDGVMRSVLERVQKLQDLSERLEKMLLRIESSLETKKVQDKSVIPEATEVPKMLKINATDSLGQKEPVTRGPLTTNLYSPARKSLSDEEIKDLVSSPKVTLFSQENFQGDSKDYDFGEAEFEGGCHNLDNFEGNVRSVQTKGKCVRIFENIRCRGLSLAVYPGSGYSRHFLNSSKLTRVDSIGPCLEQEFLGSFYQDQTKTDISKRRSYSIGDFPDLAVFDSKEKNKKAKEFPRTSYDFSRFTLGPKNRVEYLYALIKMKDLFDSSTSLNPEHSSYFQSLDKDEGDVLGFGIPPNLGGPADENFNIFPQSPSFQKAWALQTSKIMEFLRNGRTGSMLSLNLEYEDESKTRPMSLYYHIQYYGNGKEEIIYGRLLN